MEKGAFSYANLANSAYIEALYSAYLSDPESVDISWRHFFEGMEFSSHLPAPIVQSSGAPSSDIVEFYRREGHKAAQTSPFVQKAVLSTSHDGIDPSAEVSTGGVLPEKTAPFEKVVKRLESLYCGSIGFEFSHLENPEVKAHICAAIEGERKPLSEEQKMKLFEEMTKAEAFDAFIHKKYQGQKRFSLEGGEAFIPTVNILVEELAKRDAENVAIAMAHRGRLSALAHIFAKPYEALFFEFEPAYRPPFQHVSGDVKYHLGYACEREVMGKKVHLELMPNPSHLESINAPLEGWVRALQDKTGGERKKIVPVLVHGDAAVAGQGVVYELMQMYKLKGYTTGGTIHIIINNHIGFTSYEEDARSTRYCSDIAKAFDAPVFHVNGDDPEGCAFVATLAAELRQKFGVESFIEINCYRKYGHNEGDEPRFTNPSMYAVIDGRESPQKVYRSTLLQSGIAEEKLVQIETNVLASLDAALDAVKKEAAVFTESELAPPEKKEIMTNTTLDERALTHLGSLITTIPEEVHLHPKIQRIIADRKKMIDEGKEIDWGCAEHLAFASLLMEKVPIRISGQDARRGTFAHRHAALIDQETEKPYFPLQNLGGDAAHFEVYNSLLSEYAVLGFEFGYSAAFPEALVIWEAQYGDFANGAQIIFDQYISSSEEKWNQTTSLVCMLPHGYEGGGPEHSSARMERFLQAAAKENMRIVIPSTAAQLFHVLRRQGLSQEKKPLILFTPKELLRYGPSLSSKEAFTSASFLPIIGECSEKTKRLLLCSGKVYYELEPLAKDRDDIAILRIEQLYPFDAKLLSDQIAKATSLEKIIWVQEEPKNMGAWNYISPLLRSAVSDRLRIEYAGRDESASTAAGSSSLHKKQKKSFLEKAFE